MMGFFEACGFMLELLATSVLYTVLLNKRRNSFIRYSVSVVVTVAISWLWSVFATPAVVWAIILRSLILYLLCYLALWFCVQLTWKQALFFVAGTVALQHASYSCAQIGIIYLPYIRVFLKQSGLEWILYPVLFVIFLGIGYFLFVRPMQGRIPENMGDSFILVAVGIMLCVTVFSSLFDAFTAQANIEKNAYFMFVLTRVITCIFLLILLREIVDRETAQRDSDFLHQLLNQQRQKLDSDRETIDLINIKTHDLKKQLTVLRGSVSQEEIDELKELVDIYDSSIHTGNDTLDVLLANKSLICEQRRIQFDRMVNGTHLSFMKSADIYSLFGNAIDNAMEAVTEIDDIHNRYIRMKVNESKGMLVIHIENPYKGEIHFVDNLPQTTKADKRYHGFGVKSMRMLVERYHGVMNLRGEGGIFTLNILLPLGNDAQ